MKLSPSESKMLELIRAVGGTYCPDAGAHLNREAMRLMRRLERKGHVTVEQVDTGFRFTLAGGADA